MDIQKLWHLLLADGDLDLDLKILTFDTLTSTNEKLWQLVCEENAPMGTIVIADRQTAGRGQRGRKWESTPGGLYLSMAISPDLPVENIQQLTIGIAWGIADRLRRQGIPVLLKWPNDLLLSGRKLGGILTETKIVGDRIRQAIVGVGINHTNSVEGKAINLAPCNDFQLNDRSCSIEMLTTCTIKGIISGYKRCTPATLDGLLSDYLELLNARGRSVIVNDKLGTVVGVSPRGELHIAFANANEVTEIYLQPGTFTLGYES